MREYQRLETGEGDVNRGTAEVYYTVQPMSSLHKVAFISSILFCIAVVVSFLWLVPCDLDTCPASQPQPLNIPWDRTLNGLELFGGVHVVGGRFLVVSMRGALWGKSEFENGGGVVGLAADQGTVLWWIPLPAAPLFLSCPPQEPPVCFIVVPPAAFEAVNPISGVASWGLSSEEWKKIEYPLLVPDVDKDGFADLAAIVRTAEGFIVVVVSGRLGKVTTRLKVPVACQNAANLTFDQATAELHYYCTRSNIDVTKERLPVGGILAGGPAAEGVVGRSTGSTEGHTVEYRNTGNCPDTCQVELEVRDPNGTTLYTIKEKQAYVMRPLPLHFKPSLSSFLYKPARSGFLFKLWHWHLPVQERGGLKVESIKERIVLITFDNKPGSGGHVVNASQTDITRLCNVSLVQPVCQPTILTDTALIADVNGDGSQDLVSYYVTYKPWGADKALAPASPGATPALSWQLESRIRVIRLEAELPRLYEAVASH